MYVQKFVNSNERIHRRLMDGGNTTMAMTFAPLETFAKAMLLGCGLRRH